MIGSEETPARKLVVRHRRSSSDDLKKTQLLSLADERKAAIEKLKKEAEEDLKRAWAKKLAHDSPQSPEEMPEHVMADRAAEWGLVLKFDLASGKTQGVETCKSSENRRSSDSNRSEVAGQGDGGGGRSCRGVQESPHKLVGHVSVFARLLEVIRNMQGRLKATCNGPSQGTKGDGQVCLWQAFTGEIDVSQFYKKGRGGNLQQKSSGAGVVVAVLQPRLSSGRGLLDCGTSSPPATIWPLESVKHQHPGPALQLAELGHTCYGRDSMAVL